MTTLKAAAGPLLNSNLNQNRLLALRVLALALAVNARSGGDYTTPGALQPAVREFFNAGHEHVEEVRAYLLLAQAAHYGALPFASDAAGLAAVDALFSAMGPKELKGAEVFLQCKLNAVLP